MSGRPCGWCNSVHRSDWETRHHAGESIQQISEDTGFHASAGYRHFREHVAQPALGAIRRAEASQLGVASFADRVLGLADEAAATRARASRSGNHRIALMSLKEERDSLSLLMTRLGVNEAETVEQLQSARALATSISAVLSNHPAIAQALADHLYTAGQEDLAQAFGRLAERATTRQLQPVSIVKGISA